MGIDSKSPSKAGAGRLKESINFDNLLLVEKPDSPLNSISHPETLEGCVGYLQRLPLTSPNADSKIPSTIANMVNILTQSEAAARFDKERHAYDGRRKEGEPDAVFDYDGELMQIELAEAQSRAGHSKAPGVLGHIVKPGAISFYTLDGKTFAVSEGRWWLMKSPIKAKWMSSNRNVSLDHDHVIAGEVHIIRVLPGQVGLIRAQGAEVLLDVGTHVFNSGTVSVVGKIAYNDRKHFNHGRFHYLRVERGYYAKVWAVVSLGGVETVVPRLIGQGVHYIDNHMFKFEGFVKCSENVIQHGRLGEIFFSIIAN